MWLIVRMLWVLWLPQLVMAAEPLLTLDAAVEQALAGAPQIAAQDAAVDAARAAGDRAGRLPDPELIVAIDNLPVDSADQFSLTRDFMTMRRVGVMQSFTNGAKRSLARERGVVGIALADSERGRTRFEVSQSVADAWVRRAASRQFEASLRELLPIAELAANSARAALATGRGSAGDALAARATVGALQDRILGARFTGDLAQTDLQSWLREAATQPSASLADFRERPLPSAALLDALDSHATQVVLQRGVDAARVDLALAKAERRPDWSAEFSYAKRGPDFSNMVNLEFRVGLPLFPRHRQGAMAAEQRSRLTQTELAREAQTRAHAAEVSRMRLAWHSARERLELLERERLPLARDGRQAAIAAYRAGRSELAPVAEAITQEVELTEAQIELESEIARAWSYLNYLTAFGSKP